MGEKIKRIGQKLISPLHNILLSIFGGNGKRKFTQTRYNNKCRQGI